MWVDPKRQMGHFSKAYFLIKYLNSEDIFHTGRKVIYTVYWFPTAAVRNYHKFGGVKQHRFILLQLWRSEV